MKNLFLLIGVALLIFGTLSIAGYIKPYDNPEPGTTVGHATESLIGGTHKGCTSCQWY